jgi:hypothetical protein
MQHTHKINDRDPYFEIDAVTRKIVNKSSSKVSIIQYDHNSERFTFVLPRYIEEHDMSEVTKAEVHYMSGKTKTPGIYTMTDLAISPEDDDKVVCTWLLSQNVTMETGAISFVLRLSCIGEDGSIEYAWSTAIFTGISVAEGIYNAEAIVEQYADVLEQWKEELQNGAGGAGGSTELFVINVLEADGLLLCDKSHDEVVAAIEANKQIIVVIPDDKTVENDNAQRVTVISAQYFDDIGVVLNGIIPSTNYSNGVFSNAMEYVQLQCATNDIWTLSSINILSEEAVDAKLKVLEDATDALALDMGDVKAALLEIEAMADSLIGGDA